MQHYLNYPRAYLGTSYEEALARRTFATAAANQRLQALWRLTFAQTETAAYYFQK